jgi:hypothetical protein
MVTASIMFPRNFRRRLLLGDENDGNQALDNAAGNDGGLLKYYRGLLNGTDEYIGTTGSSL